MNLEQYLITVSEAPKILYRSAESVRKYERTGKLTAIKTTRGMRLLRESDLRAFAKNQESGEQEIAAVR